MVFQFGNLDKFHDWIIPGTNKTAVEYAAPAWEAYSQRHLGSSPSYLTSQWFLAFVGFAGHLRLGWLVPSIILFVPLISIQYFQYNLLYRGIGFGRRVSVVGGLLYFLSPFVFYRIASGYIYFTIAYSLFPLFLYALQKAVSTAQRKHALIWSFIAGWVVVICGWQIQFFVFAVILGGLWLLITNGSYQRKALVTGSIALTNIVASLPWVLPFLFKSHDSNARQALSLGFIDYQSNFTSLINVYKGYGSFVNYLTIWLGELRTELAYIYYISASILMLTAFLGIYAAMNKQSKLHIRPKRFVIGALIILCVTLFLAKGFNEPLGFINKFLYQRFILFGLFREIHHLSFLIIFILNVFTVWAFHMYARKFKFLHRLNFVTVAILCLYIGLSLPVLSGNWGFLQRNRPSQELIQTIDDLEGERVWFLPNLQPYADTLDSKYGGWDLTQSLSNISTLPQGNISDTYAKNQNNRLTYCLIFDKSCSGEILPGLQRLGFDYIIVRNDITSIYSKVSALGVFKDEREIFNTFDYNKRLLELGLTPSKKFSDHTVYRLQPGFNLSYVQNANVGYLGDVGLDTKLAYKSLQFPEYSANGLDYIISAENKSKLLELFAVEGAIVHEPGFFVDGGDWRSYQSRWWLHNNTKSPYNGIFSEIEEGKLTSFVNEEMLGEYEVWLIPGQMPEGLTGTLKLHIPDAGLHKVIELDELISQSGPMFLGNVSVDTQSLEIDYTHVEGFSTLQSLVFVPNNAISSNTNNTIVLKNGHPSIDTERSSRNTIHLPVNSFNLSAFNDGGRKTRAQTQLDDDRVDLWLTFTEDQSIGEFVTISRDLKDIPIEFVQQFEKAVIPLYTDNPDDIIMDVNITIEDEDQKETIFFRRFNELEEENELELDLKVLANIAQRKGFSEQTEVSRIAFLINKKRDQDLSQRDQFISIKDIELVAPFTHTYSDMFLAEYNFLINKNVYYQNLVQYSPIPMSRDWRFRPFLRRGIATGITQVESNVILDVDVNSPINEFAVSPLPNFNAEILMDTDVVLIPVNYNTSDAFIDMVYTYINDQGEEVRSSAIRPTVLPDGNQYLILDVKQIRDVNGIDDIVDVEVVLNKRPTVSDKSQVVFTLSEPLYLDDYYDVFVNTFAAPDKETYLNVLSPEADLYEIEFVTSNDSRVEEVFLEEGMNAIKVPKYREDTVFNYALAKPIGVDLQAVVQDVTMNKIDAGLFEFELPIQQENGIFVYQMMYDPDWVLEIDGRKVSPERYNFLFNGFEVRSGEGGNVHLRYRLQRLKTYSIYLTIALLTVHVVYGIIIISRGSKTTSRT